jgi:peroxiredoxin
MKTFLTFICLFASTLLVAQIDTDHLIIGETAPSIRAKDQNGKLIDSKEILKENQILLIFYRGNWCPHCMKHLSSLQTHLQEFKEKGIFVMVVTPEKLEKTQETGNQYQNEFSIVHDVNNKIMMDYKVAFEVNKETVPAYYEKLNQRLEEYNNENNKVLPVPATYLIDRSSKISYVHYDPDYKKRSDLNEILELLD